MESKPIEKQTLRILFLASEPNNMANLRLGAELQEIRNRLSGNSFFEIKDRQAVKPDDVLQTILNYKPHIVHFSGHGQNNGDICFEDEKGNTKIIPPDALASLFELTTDHVKCVVVNTCYSEAQAKAISQFVPIVVGTKKDITDSAAIKFSTGFYTALDPDLSQKSLRKAFDSGCIAVKFENLPESLTPIIIEGSPEVRFSSEVDTAFLSISTPKGLVFQALNRGLSLTGKKMGLSDSIVLKILKEKIEKLELHNNGIIEYEKYLNDILRDEFPLSELSNLALLQLQNGLDLPDEDIAIIRNRVFSNPNLTTAERWYDRGRGQFNINNYKKAIEYFTKAIERDSDYSGAHYERGYCYDKIGDTDLALEDFTKSIEFNNKWEMTNNLKTAYYSRARCFQTMRSEDEEKSRFYLEESIKGWNKTIELDEKYADAYYGRGISMERSGDYEKALVDYLKSYELSDEIKDSELQSANALRIGRIYWMKGQLEEAKTWWAFHKGDATALTEDDL